MPGDKNEKRESVETCAILDSKAVSQAKTEVRTADISSHDPAFS
jgi:hypothetical protein